MKIRKRVISGIIAAAIAVSPVACFAGEEQDSSAVSVYENADMKLSIPEEYDDLLVTETPQDDENGILFTVSEKASVDAAAEYADAEGAGWIFSIARISEEELHDKLCFDMSGEEVFAKDEDGMYYTFNHTTDVRFVRENYENIEEDQAQWTMLNEWAQGIVRDTFIAENDGLAAVVHSNTDLDMYLARIAYQKDVNYTISTTEFGPMEPKDVDPTPYIDRLVNDVTFEAEPEMEAPDGEYVVLYFPDDDVRFDFFPGDGENLVRQVWAEDNEMMYKATFADDANKASEIMQEWYLALVDANE